MYPYLHKAKRMMPNLVMPKQIRSHRPGKKKIMRVMGNAYAHNKTLVIATHNQMTYMNRKGELRVKKIVRLPQAQMLDTLAHEIAHLQYPTHGYEHDEFTRAIFKTFGLKEKCPHCKGSGKIQMEGRY
jgi:excinuclease UvrABC ATPase subunit